MKSGNRGYWLVLLVILIFFIVDSSRLQAEPAERPTFKAPKHLESTFEPDEVLVKFKDLPATFRGRPSREHLRSLQGVAAKEFAAALPDKAQAALEKLQGQVTRAHPHIGLLKVNLPPRMSVSQAIDNLYRSGAVEYAEPNARIIPQAIPNDLQYINQWGVSIIKAPDAWDIIQGGSNTIVAVIDTGVDYLHEDFYDILDNPLFRFYTANKSFPGDPLQSNLWVNRGEEVDNIYYPGSPNFYPPKIFLINGIDEDVNNFVDDYFGINTTVTPSSGDPMDTNGHGTAMAGIIGAVGNNSRGIAGINWKTKIMSLKAMTSTTGNVDSAITCINYALTQRAKSDPKPPMVLVLGWSQTTASYSNAMHDALRIAQDAGVLVVAAAGNDDEDNDIFPNYPSSYNHDPKDFPATGNITLDNIISVGASDQSDRKETNSSYGMATVDLFAPGKAILSTIPGNRYSTGTGTSFAAAHVAGACALLWNKYPDKDWKQIKALIMNGVEDGSTQDFRAICVAEGRLNLANSLDPGIENAPAVFSVFEISNSPASGDPNIVPGRGDTGNTLVITGVNFGTAAGAITFLDTVFPLANIVNWSEEKIIATVPANLAKGTGRLQVTTAAGTSRGACFSNISREKVVGSLILARGLAASAQIGNDVWIIGGRTYWGVVPHVEKYSLDTNHTVVDSDWMMPTPVSNAGAASIDSKIYVVGGATEDDTLVPYLQIFDTTSLTWQTGLPMPKPLMQCTVTSVGTKIYVCGGIQKINTTYSAVKDAFVYDTESNSWNAITALPTAVAYAAGAVTGSGKIWLMGGFSNYTTTTQQRFVHEYDPITNLWTQKVHLVRPRGGAAGINCRGVIYCLQGTEPYSTTVYDKYTDGEWYNSLKGYWMPSIMNYLGIYVPPANVLARKGMYTPSPGKYQNKIYLLGGVTGIELDYKYSYSNKVWAFTAIPAVRHSLPWLPLLLGE
jgi:subtilisin family serine protease